MKVAIVHDELLRKGGAERVVISMHKMYPDADIFTSSYRPEKTFEYFKKCNIRTSFLNPVISNERILMALFFPWVILSFKLFNLRKYDLVLISSAHGAQYIRKPRGISINYAHFLFRLVWEPESYSFFSGGNINNIIKPFFYLARRIDKWLTLRADYTVFNSNKTQVRYLKVFGPIKNWSVLPPPIPLSDFYISDEPKDYFLVVSRLEFYKKVDVAIKAFNNIPKEKLIVVGSGTKEKELKLMVKHDNISFEKNISAERLRSLYSNCKALIFPQVEDFGITPVECNASGRPVIAFKQGGVLESMMENSDVQKSTVLYFSEQTEESLINKLRGFDYNMYNSQNIRNNALRFSEERFHKKVDEIVSSHFTD